MNPEFIDDYDFVVNTIKAAHPSGVPGLDPGFDDACKEFRESIADRRSLIRSLGRLTACLNDGHTNIELPYGKNDLCLNIPCGWFGDTLYVTENYKHLRCGDEILSINDVPVGEYFKKLCAFIPHENNYLVKCRSTKFPYQNYHLFSQFNLAAILHNDSPVYSIRAAGKETAVVCSCNLEEYNGCADFIDTTDFAVYEIIGDSAVLQLDECRFNQTYVNTLNEFFEAVRTNRVQNLVIDLSENMGGNSAVVQEFIRHLDIESFRFYGVDIREFNGKLYTAHNREETVKNETDYQYLYGGKITCVISNSTFSSAVLFAAVLKDNRIAELAGENSGGKPTSFGAPTKFVTPHTNIRFRVSARAFYRPDEAKDSENSLVPDLPITKTIHDVSRSSWNIRYNCKNIHSLLI